MGLNRPVDEDNPVNQAFALQEYRQKRRPWQTRQEYLVDIALDSAISDPETIRATRPVVPQALNPERRGFAKSEQGIMDIINTSRETPSYRSWVSGSPVMLHNGSLVDDTFSGSGRYSMTPMWT
jgi:hypothetical protein